MVHGFIKIKYYTDCCMVLLLLKQLGLVYISIKKSQFSLLKLRDVLNSTGFILEPEK